MIHTKITNNNFKSVRERAELALPYQIKDLKERERVLNILEVIIYKHRQKKHGENYNNRIKKLIENTNMAKDEYDMIIQPRGFWN